MRDECNNYYKDFDTFLKENLEYDLHEDWFIIDSNKYYSIDEIISFQLLEAGHKIYMIYWKKEEYLYLSPNGKQLLCEDGSVYSTYSEFKEGGDGNTSIHKWLVIDLPKNKLAKKGSKMTTKLAKAKTQVKSDVQNAAWRKASKATVSSAKKAVLKLLSSKLDNATVALVKGFLETPEGEATLSILFGTAIQFVPTLEDNEKLTRLSDEMRINGYETLMSSLLDSMINPVMQSLSTVLKEVKLPK